MKAIVSLAITASLVLAGLARAAEPMTLKGHTKQITTIQWSADGKTLATASADRTARLWDPASGKETAKIAKMANDGYGSPVVAFTVDLKQVAVNYWGAITIRTVADDQVLHTIDPILDRGQKSSFRPDVFAMEFSPDGKRLVTAGSTAAVGGPHGLPGGIVIVWDTKTGTIVHQSERLSSAVSSVAWSPDGKHYVAGTNGAGGELPEPGKVHVWNAETGKVVHQYSVKDKSEQGEWASVGDVAFSGDSKRVAVPMTAGSRGTPAGLLIDDTGASIRVWELATGKTSQPVKGLKASVSRVQFSPDGKTLAMACNDQVVRVWDLGTEKEIAAFKTTSRVTAIAFSPDGKSLASGGGDGAVQIWAVKQ